VVELIIEVAITKVFPIFRAIGASAANLPKATLPITQQILPIGYGQNLRFDGKYGCITAHA